MVTELILVYSGVNRYYIAASDLYDPFPQRSEEDETPKTEEDVEEEDQSQNLQGL